MEPHDHGWDPTMKGCQFALLNDRGVLRVAGAEAEKFLQGLITSDMDRLEPQLALHAGLLTPQGKIIFDFFVVRAAEGFLIDVLKDKAADLVKRLNFYRLRAQVTITDVSAEHAVAVCWGGTPPPNMLAMSLAAFSDPRLPALGWRAIVRLPADWPLMRGAATEETEADYHASRVALGVPEGGKDYVLGDTFPHEALFDQLHGVDFDKGCYVGQEVVSRIQHRATTRKRVVKVQSDEPLPASGTEVKAGAAGVGTLGSVTGRIGLALLRLDRAAEAHAKDVPLTAAGVTLTAVLPEWASFSMASPAKGESE
jgi:tRNA-modifying protein YgfZ